MTQGRGTLAQERDNQDSEHAEIAANANSDPRRDYKQIFSEEVAALEAEIEPVLILAPTNQATLLRHDRVSRFLKKAGIVLTAGWFAFCFCASYTSIGLDGLSKLQPHEIGGFLAGMMAPAALFWMVIAYVQRDTDVQIYARHLRHELQNLLFPSEDHDVHVTRNIQILVEQAAQLAQASKASLQAIYKARKGLHEELREFTTLAHKAEHHIKNLSLGITERIDGAKSLTSEIEERTSALDGKGMAGIRNWENAVATLMGRVGEIEKALDGGAARILDAAHRAEENAQGIRDKLHGSTDGLTESVRGVAERLREITGTFELHSKSLTDASDRAGQQARYLGELIDGQIVSFEATTERAVSALSSSTGSIGEEREKLDETVASLSRRSLDMVGVVDENIVRLDDAGDRLIEKAGNLHDSLERRTLALDEAVARFASYEEKLENAGTGAIRALGEASAMAMSGANAVRDAMDLGITSLTTCAATADTQADRIADALAQQVEGIRGATGETAAKLEQLLELFAHNKTQLDQVAGDATGQVARLSEAIENQTEKLKLSAFDVTNRIDQIKKSFEEPLRAISKAVTEAGDRSDDINTALSRRIEELSTASEKAAQQAEHIRDTLRGQAQEISQLSGEIAGNARTISKQFTDHRDTVVETLDDALRRAEAAKETLSGQISVLRTSADEAQQKITAVSGLIVRHTEELSENVNRSEGELGRLNSQLVEQKSTVAAISEKTTAEINRVVSTLTERAKQAQDSCESALARAESARERFDALSAAYETSTDANFSRIEQLGDLFDGRLAALKEGSTTVATDLREVSETLQSRLQEIQDTARNASEKIHNIGQALDSQSADIHLTTDQATLRVEAVQKAFNEQFHELAAIVGRAVTQIREAGAEFERCTTQVDQSAELIAGRFSTAGENARVEAQQLAKIAETTAHLTDTVAGKLGKGAQNLFDQAQSNMARLGEVRDDLVARAQNMSEEIGRLVSQAKDGSKLLRDEVASVTTASQSSADHIRKVTYDLSEQIHGVSRLADDIGKRIENVTLSLNGQSGKLITVTETTARAIDESASVFARQSAALIKASREATEQAEEIRKAETRTQRNAYLSSSKFIIESLHSLSVDFTRILETEIPEKTWKSFQKGEVSAFTRRLVHLRESGALPVERIRQKYADDSEFRTYMQRYIRLFEENYDQALPLDHGSLLAATFMSADTGKLYQFLCTAIDREYRDLPETGMKDAA